MSFISDFQFTSKPNSESCKLGTGAFGEVRLARNRYNQKLYALKIVNI